MTSLHLSQDPDADALLSQDRLALLLGMALDQQIPMEKAFQGPHVLRDRLGRLDAGTIASYEPAAFAALVGQTPAVHRFPGSMAKRLQDLCAALVEQYNGRAEAVWEDVADGAQLLRRLEGLPGFGKQKAQIFIALLGKQLGVQPTGWREAAGAYGEDGALKSVADVTGPETLQQVRAYKQSVKAAAKAAKG
ncbi:MAG: Fe-S cluster assembly protein HesB [Frankiaceae bacterium]|nr:Fe-S cluster assembly protein HesB [Frankiaceae bacterium]